MDYFFHVLHFAAAGYPWYLLKRTSMDHHSDASFTQIEEEAMRAGFATHDTEQARLVIGIDYGTTFTGKFDTSLAASHG